MFLHLGDRAKKDTVWWPITNKITLFFKVSICNIIVGLNTFLISSREKKCWDIRHHQMMMKKMTQESQSSPEDSVRVMHPCTSFVSISVTKSEAVGTAGHKSYASEAQVPNWPLIMNASAPCVTHHMLSDIIAKSLLLSEASHDYSRAALTPGEESIAETSEFC